LGFVKQHGKTIPLFLVLLFPNLKKMPQFDKITFLNQLFWLAALFTVFFFLCNNFFFPQICGVLKGRYKKLQKKSGFLLPFTKELKNTSVNANFIFDKAIFSIKSSTSRSVEKTSQCITKMLNTIINSNFSSDPFESVMLKQNTIFFFEKKKLRTSFHRKHRKK
jgi:hypothetical protein